jgi:hypothetical protein
MPYPDRYSKDHDFAAEERRGDPVSGTALNAELARLQEVTNQLNGALRQITTTDGRLKLDQAVRVRDVIEESLHDGTGVSPQVITFPQEIDSAVDLVRVWELVAGVWTRLTPVSYTDNDVTLNPAPAVGVENVKVIIYTNMAGILDRMRSVVQDFGASFVGYDDVEGRYAADNVRDALTEVRRTLDSLITGVGDLSRFVTKDGLTRLTGQWELNPRGSMAIQPAAATGYVQITGIPVNGSTVEINDGVLTTIFEYNTGAPAPGNVVVAPGANYLDACNNLAAAINASPLAVEGAVVDINPGVAGRVNITHEIPYALGNQPIVVSGAGLTASGMAGGLDGSPLAALTTHYRIRNAPPSIRDGDVVVHEQLRQLVLQISGSLTAFLRIDGANQMVANMRFGGYRGTQLAAGTDPADAVNKQQLDDEETAREARDLQKLSTAGTKDTVGEGTITGPVTLDALATDTADTDQATDPDAVVVHTIHGVPLPAADDQVANKKYVDDRPRGFGNATGWAVNGAFAWVVPAGITKIMVRVWGAGGGGSVGGGGGGGGGLWAILPCIPGENAAITVGNGGLAGVGGGASNVTCNGGAAAVTAGGGAGAGAGPGLGGVNILVGATAGRGAPGQNGEATAFGASGGDAGNGGGLGGQGGGGNNGLSPGGGGMGAAGLGSDGAVEIWW